MVRMRGSVDSFVWFSCGFGLEAEEDAGGDARCGTDGRRSREVRRQASREEVRGLDFCLARDPCLRGAHSLENRGRRGRY